MVESVHHYYIVKHIILFTYLRVISENSNSLWMVSTISGVEHINLCVYKRRVDRLTNDLSLTQHHLSSQGWIDIAIYCTPNLTHGHGEDMK